MLQESKLELLQKIISGSSKEELIWMNGYISASIGTGQPAPSAVVRAAVPSVNKITVVYGTETGNSKRLAADFASKAKKTGVQAKLVSLDQYRLNDLAKEEYLLAVISTQGEGEPPAAAKKFYDHIHNNGFKLDKLKYGVLALGDTSYPLFCKAGEDVDAQLQKLGGRRIAEIQRCDVDYEEEASLWFDNVLQQLSSTGAQADMLAAPVTVKKSSGKKFYKGRILQNTNLNDRGSDKQTHHIEIAADELNYQPGDSIGIIPHDPATGGPSAPRLYSIASSLQQHDGEVHITVARKKYCVEGEISYGLCSDYLTQLPADTELEFYIHRNHLFKLPEEDQDIIMIGPGTGIAPFRSFLSERDATGASGRNWLFFGDQHFETDFLYQTEIQNWVETGVLSRVNVAFSRDQQEKIYVQHKMLKHGKDLYEWLQGGAYLYVCGTKDPMSADVEHTLLAIFEQSGNMSPEAAVEYLNELKDQDRYLKDVY